MRLPALNPRLSALLLLLLLLTACSAGAPTTEPAAIGPRPSPTTTPAADTTRPAVSVTNGGQNPNGTFYRGVADAPVTILEYSDFL